jgi:TolB-like protein/class 3 adenylate cyclase/Tfp pilus assembly protein PilF
MSIGSEGTGSEKPAVAVLPFEVLQHEPAHPYLGDAIAEEVITTLSRIPQLRVIARGSSFQYRESVPDLDTIGRELDVRYVVQGSVRTAANRVRVTAHLGDVFTGAEVWSDRYDRDLDDVFALQDEISSEIATTLEVKLGYGEQVRFWRRGQRSLEAYEHFARFNEEYLKFSRSANKRARLAALAAIDLAPDFTSALVALGSTYATEAHLGWSPDRGESLYKAREGAERALAVEEGSPEANALLGRILMLEGSYEEAIATTGKALDVLPNYAWGYHLQAMNLLYAGRFAEAVDADRQVFLLSPLSDVQSDNARLYMATAYCQLGRYHDALEELAKVLKRHPSWQMALTQRIVALVGIGDLAAARDDARALLRVNPRFSTSGYAVLNPYKNDADLQNMLDPLHAVGLPEQPGEGDLLGDDTEVDPTSEARRELATVLFTDIVASTRMAVESGDRRWREILDAHDEMARASVTASRGRLVKSTGDGILAVFDRPSDAVLCTREMLTRAGGLGLELRAGVHTGEVELRGADVAGIAVHVAARVAAKARANEVMVTRTVRDLIAGSDYSPTSVGLVELKGLPEAVELYSIEI